MNQLKVLAFTHQKVDLQDLGKFVVCTHSLSERLEGVKAQFAISEIFYIGTCNRVEFVFRCEQEMNSDFLKNFLSQFHQTLTEEQLAEGVKQVEVYEGEEAFRHLLRVSCSMESLVVGEKEILAQVRKSYEQCRKAGFTGDFMRMIMSHLVKAAKEVYTNTNIARNPISVVSLAYRKLRDLKVCSNSRILIIGAGETNQNIAKYLNKHKVSNFAVFNRTLSKAEALAAELQGEAFGLDSLMEYKKGFDVIITCTSATEPILTNTVYQSLLNGESGKKIIVDLAIPNDTAPEVLANNPVHLIEVNSLQELANQNMMERYQELVHAEKIIEDNIDEFRPILRQRQVELAMREVPQKIKEIKRTAFDSVFADEIDQLDETSREVLERVVAYIEKKYISVPMVMAKEILVNNS